MNCTFRPIDNWPGEKRRTPKRSHFKVRHEDTLRLLDRELVTLRAKNIVIQIDLQEGDIRLDGLPRSTARPATPRVVLSFESKHGALKYYADTFDNWQDNLRAIALGLEHLRAVDRYGITNRGEQYTGWKALPGPGPGQGSLITPPTMTAEQAAEILVDAAGAPYPIQSVIHDPDVRKVVYRLAVKQTHPDCGGQEDYFKQVQQAWELLQNKKNVEQAGTI
jgi:hypothetical protein